MKRWKKYEKYLLCGDWHIHTNYTDGKNTIFEYCKQAEKNGLELIAFTEHVRKDLTYNFEDFISDIYSAKDMFDLVIIGGCEAKVLDLEGGLDVSKDVLKNCEVVLGAFHSFGYRGKEYYLTALCNMLKNPDVDIWAHPMRYAERTNLTLTKPELHLISIMSLKYEVLIEKNTKYSIDKKFLKIASATGCRFVYGGDAHDISELSCKFKNYK